MRSGRSGITPVVAIVILVLLSATIAGSVFVWVNGIINEQTAKGTQALHTEIDVKGFSSAGRTLYVKNSGRTPVTLDVYADNGERIPAMNSTPLQPDEFRSYRLGCLPEGTKTIRIDAEGKTYRQDVGEVSLQYCIEITDASVEVRDATAYKVFKGNAHLNNASRTPYANKQINYSFDDGETQTLTTDSEGNFQFEALWEIAYIPENGLWSKNVEYESPTPVIRFHQGKGRFQPPNTVRLEYDDGVTEVVETQEVLEEVENNHFDLTYQILPQSISDTDVTFTATATLTAKQGLEDDWNNNPGDALLYQIAIPEGSSWGGPYAQVQDISCSSSSDITCQTGETQYTVSTNVQDASFESDTLPQDESGDKYLPVRFDVVASEKDAVAGINPNFYFHHGGEEHNNSDFNHQWYFFDNAKRMAYIPRGETITSWQNYSLNWLQNNVENQFSDPNATINTTYHVRHSLVMTPHLWWAPPSTSRIRQYFSLNQGDREGFTSDGTNTESMETLLYQFQDVTAGEEYQLNFTVTLQRESGNTWFALPVNLGTFGMFPSDGGEALSVGRRYGAYTNGGIRYPPFRNTGRFSFKTLIPGTSSGSRALVYKTTLPKDDDTWDATTYVLNGDENNIDRIYLLNARGEWDVFETSPDGDNNLDPGEYMSGGFDVTQEGNELVQSNLQFQLINGGAEEPEYSDWPYAFNLTLTNSSGSVTHDLSDTVDCRTRYCLSYRVGNGDEAVPIDQLRGPAAPTSVFEDLTGIQFGLENADASGGAAALRLKEFKFWTWYLQPFTDNMDDDLSENPDTLTMETTEHDSFQQGQYTVNFD